MESRRENGEGLSELERSQERQAGSLGRGHSEEGLGGGCSGLLIFI